MMTTIIENPFAWIYFPTALALGALHALEPGHAKTLTAAYLIGIKGTKRDALLLGLSVALTHSLVVVGISVAALLLGRSTFTQDVTHYLQLASGVIVIVLGVWMLIRRMRQQHLHEPSIPIAIKHPLTSGVLDIINTSGGERMRYIADTRAIDLAFRVIINRNGELESLELAKSPTNDREYISHCPPQEPHEFNAEFEITTIDQRELVTFEMKESHHHLDDDEHARAHAATIPEYAKNGTRPTRMQIIAFGAAGGMIPCPASITVMLLALSIGKLASGLFAVAGFSVGLAVTLVGVGLIVVAGINTIKETGRFHWLTSQAPILSAGIVILSGVTALIFSH